MKYYCLVLFCALCFHITAQNQDVIGGGNLDIDLLSDAQIESYWLRAQSQGYSLNDIDQLGRLQGLSTSNIGKIRSRIQNLTSTEVNKKSFDVDKRKSLEVRPFGNGGNLGSVNKPSSSIFGYDFFNNPNISFEPNLNLATPKNYQVGPGDELVISVWGAAENSYEVKVNPDGTIRIPNIGPIFVSGLSIELATQKVKSSLKRIYNGITASSNSPYKVNVDLSLTKVRLVQVDIIGEVTVPGTYSLTALSSLMNALYAAGGPNSNGTFRDILHVRNGVVINNFDVYEYLLKGKGNGNNNLEDQDVIIVRPYKKRVSISGAVKRSGLFEVKENETFNDIKAFFGGFSSKAYKDRIVVKRIENGQLAIKEVNLLEEPDTYLLDGDKIMVNKVVEKYTNRISIAGAINRPGEYELTEKLRLSDLLQKALGVSEDAFMERGLIYRLDQGYIRTIEPFSVSDVLNGKFNIDLQKEDSIYIFSQNRLNDKKTISISGAVNNPRTMPFINNLTVKDFIAIAGGFKDGANSAVINISRKINDENFETESKTYLSPKIEDLKVSSNDEFYLEPYDRVTVRYLKGYTGVKNVRVLGEVEYPGNYSIINKNDRVSDLIKQAGGLSPYAFLEGSTLLRNIKKNTLEEQSTVVNNISRLDSISNNNLNGRMASIGLDLDKILNGGEGSKYDIILQEDDILSIPSQKQTVQVKGEVLAPSLIRYDRRSSLKDYINGSGGFSNNAKRRKAYVIYSNGEVKATKSFLFFRSYPKPKPGSVILVPPKPAKRERLSPQEVIGITTGLGTIGLLIDRLSSN